MVPKPKVDGKYDVSIETADIEKVPIIYSQTPDGRQRLLIYFRKLEKLIAKEAGERKVDIEAVRAQMARNQAYNAAASKKDESRAAEEDGKQRERVQEKAACSHA